MFHVKRLAFFGTPADRIASAISSACSRRPRSQHVLSVWRPEYVDVPYANLAEAVWR